MTIRIVTDSACDLPSSALSEHGITVVPLKIRFGDQEFVDREELSTAEFWARCSASAELPSTAAPSVGNFTTAYQRLAAEGATGIVAICLSSSLSATMQSAQLAADEVAGSIPVVVVDSRSVSLGLGMMVIAAAQAAARGATLDQTADVARDLVPRTHVWAAFDTLENLKKGGRIGGAKAFLASALAIKPIIVCRDGEVHEGGKQRTRAKALAFLVDKVKEHPDVTRVAVAHADCSDVDAFVEMLRPSTQGDILVGDIGAVIGTHAGRGTIAVVFQTAS